MPSKSRALFDSFLRTISSDNTSDPSTPSPGPSSKPPTTPQPKSNAPPASPSAAHTLPRLYVFDLDFTLWPFWVDTHPTPPLKPNEGASACLDKYGESFAPYPEVGAILAELKNKGVIVAAASRTCAPELARDLLKMLVVDVGGRRRKMIEFFDYLEIYPGSKVKHFERIQKATGLRYEDMLFFDDEERNGEVESLGVTMCLVKNGVSRAEINRGVEKWKLRWVKL